jgi:hypothetical protein
MADDGTADVIGTRLNNIIRLGLRGGDLIARNARRADLGLGLDIHHVLSVNANKGRPHYNPHGQSGHSQLPRAYLNCKTEYSPTRQYHRY